jgi:hypothetical protein
MLVDVALGCTAVAGLAASNRLRPAQVPDMAAAFGLLERAIQKYMPDLPPGYTWHEAIERLRGARIDANWDAIESAVGAYEASRYGGRGPPSEGKEDVVSLVLKIRGLGIGKRTKR